ncbi:MAG: IS3 family transposase [Candidatus Bipolaricaulia bacterium]
MLRANLAQVERMRERLNQRRFCRFLGVSQRSYYRSFGLEESVKRGPDGRKALNEKERERIKELAREHELYGYRKVWALAWGEGIKVKPTTVYRVLKGAGLLLPRDYAKQAKRHAKRRRKEAAKRINEEWQTDILELFIPGFGKHYFMAVEDVFSRYILAWTLSPTQTGEVVVELLERAWEEAERLCGRIEGPIRVRTDNGGQYRSQAWQDYLEAVEERFDHQRTAYRSPQEIAYIESFHGKLEVEEIYQREYGDPLEAQLSIGAWVEEYNTFRPHQGLNYRTPQEVYLEEAEELRRSGGAN